MTPPLPLVSDSCLGVASGWMVGLLTCTSAHYAIQITREIVMGEGGEECELKMERVIMLNR